MMPISLRGLSPNANSKNSGAWRFFIPVGYFVAALFSLSCAFWWSTFADIARFAFLCCCPALFPFCYALVFAPPGLHERRRRKPLIIMLWVHFSLVAGLVFTWTKFPTRLGIENPDVVGGFLALEVVVIILLGRLGERIN